MVTFRSKLEITTFINPNWVFKTIDGFINLAVAGELIWKRLAETLENQSGAMTSGLQ